MPAKKPAKKTCFVIGPIGKPGSDERRHADMLLNAIVREVLERSGEFNYQAKRADEDADPGMITDRVIHDILNAELAIADLSFLNPNAFWELGLRHSAMKPVIHMAAVGTELPFDNIGHRAIFVDLGDWRSCEEAREKLAKMVSATEAEDYQPSNPITQANASFRLRDSSDSTDQLLVDMAARIRALERRFEASGLAHKFSRALAASETIAGSGARDSSENRDIANALVALGLRPTSPLSLADIALGRANEGNDDDGQGEN